MGFKVSAKKSLKGESAVSESVCRKYWGVFSGFKCPNKVFRGGFKVLKCAKLLRVH